MPACRGALCPLDVRHNAIRPCLYLPRVKLQLRRCLASSVSLCSRFSGSKADMARTISVAMPSAASSCIQSKEIADRLSISLATVKDHISSLLRKTGASSRVQLVALVRDAGTAAVIAPGNGGDPQSLIQDQSADFAPHPCRRADKRIYGLCARDPRRGTNLRGDRAGEPGRPPGPCKTGLRIPGREKPPVRLPARHDEAGTLGLPEGNLAVGRQGCFAERSQVVYRLRPVVTWPGHRQS